MLTDKQKDNMDFDAARTSMIIGDLVVGATRLAEAIGRYKAMPIGKERTAYREMLIHWTETALEFVVHSELYEKHGPDLFSNKRKEDSNGQEKDNEANWN